MKRQLFLSAAALMAMTGLAEAHSGHDSSGFLNGLIHPFTGIDHIMAMVAVGLFAAMLGGRARYLVPSSFVVMMVAGAGLAFSGYVMPYVETAIWASVIVLSAVVVLRWNASLSVAMGLCGFFAVFHGFAHGSEMPVNATGFTYGAGFVIATAALHAIGLSAGLFAGLKAAKSA
jgi:urease accessory protein